MVPEENGPAVPELARRATVSSCRHNPVRAFAPVLTAMPGQGSRSATSSTTPATPTATPVPGRCRCAPPAPQLVQDLHPHDRGPKGTHHGAIIANGNLYCPCTPRPLPELGPLARTATREQAADQDRKTAELARYKLGRITADDADGYHRVAVPRRHGQDPLPAAARLDEAGPGPARDPQPPEHPQACCTQQTLTVPPDVNAKTSAETRLPVRRAAPVLRPPHRRRTRLRHRQGPRQQRHQPRLVPPHGPGPPDAVHHDPADRPQPAHPRRLEHPAARKPPPRRRRACRRKPGAAAARPSPCSPPRRPSAAAPPRTRPTDTQERTTGSGSTPGNPRNTQKVTRRTRNAHNATAAAATPTECQRQT